MIMDIMPVTEDKKMSQMVTVQHSMSLPDVWMIKRIIREVYIVWVWFVISLVLIWQPVRNQEIVSCWQWMDENETRESSDP